MTSHHATHADIDLAEPHAEALIKAAVDVAEALGSCGRVDYTPNSASVCMRNEGHQGNCGWDIARNVANGGLSL